MKNVSFIFFLPLWIFLPSITFAVDFQAKVIHIADGDTIIRAKLSTSEDFWKPLFPHNTLT